MPRALPLILLFTLRMDAASLPPGRLPIETFSTKQGLVNDGVTHIVSDSRGDLWIGTKEGVSRFDGQRFVNYTTADGLPHAYVTKVLEARGGALYVATFGGVARLDPNVTRARGLFRKLLLNGQATSVNDIAQDSAGRIWSGCYVDLCRVGENGLVADPAFRRAGGTQVEHLVPDPTRDELWVGTDNGMMHRDAGGTWSRTAVQPHRGTDIIHGLALDRGLLWIGTSFGIFVSAPRELVPDGTPLTERITTTYAPGDRFRAPAAGEVAFIRIARTSSSVVHCGNAMRAHDGVVWIPTSAGIVRIDERIAQLDEKAGLSGEMINVAAEDRSGNLWIGCDFGGALRVAPGGVTTYTRAHGLRQDRINSIFEPFAGTLCATSGSTRFLHCFENGTLQSAEIIPHAFEFSGWGWNQVVVHARDGEWWVATGQGVVRWPALSSLNEFATAKPIAVYDSRDGLGGDEVFRVWQDSRGDLWFSTFGKRVLARRDQATQRITSYDEHDGVPMAAPTTFAEDRAGNIWIGLFTGGVLRFDRKHFQHFDERDGMPGGQTRSILVDVRGAIWIATRNGVVRIVDPTAPHLVATPVTSLATGGALTLVQGTNGTIVAGTPHGVEILDPDTKVLARISATDGLAQNEVSVAHVDGEGGLWFGTVAGLSYLPHLPSTRESPLARPRITAIQAGSANVPLAELGASFVPSVDLRWPERRMTVTFSAPDFDTRHPLRFEYRLTDEESWTEAGARRSVTYEHLPFGTRHFEVRAIDGDGKRSPSSGIALRVIPPFWRTPWFLALVIAALAAIAVALHRVRVAHLLEVQRIRTRVVTDLHDDLGSSLSRISILSELAKRRGSRDADGERVLDEIGNTSRGLIDALGDSIWSIDPRRDDVQSVMARLRHFAADVLEAKSIALQFDVPPALSTIHLPPDKRRELFLILKEAINNAARHSQATRMTIAAHVDAGRLCVRIEDDGIGIATDRPAGANGGHGLPNMAMRAKRASGTFTLASSAERGTRIDVAIPL